MLVGGGAADPVWTEATGSDAPVRATSPTIATPTITGAVTLTGGQIAFPATAVPSADANTLDDYEEGTFTPHVYDNATAGNEGSAGTGVYTKTGNSIVGRIAINAIDTTGLTAGNVLYIRDMPFDPIADGHLESAASLSNIAFGGYYVIATCSAATTRVSLKEVNSGGQGNVLISDLTDDTAVIRFNFAYLT